MLAAVVRSTINCLAPSKLGKASGLLWSRAVMSLLTPFIAPRSGLSPRSQLLASGEAVMPCPERPVGRDSCPARE